MVGYKTWKINQIEAANTRTWDNLKQTPCAAKDKFDQKQYESGVNYLKPVRAKTSIFDYIKYIVKGIKSLFRKQVNDININASSFIANL